MTSTPDNPNRRRFLALSLPLAALPLLSLTSSLAHIARRSGGEAPAFPSAAGQNTFMPSSPWESALNFARQNGNLGAYELALRNGPHDAFLNNPQRFARQIALADSSSLCLGILPVLRVIEEA